MANLFRTIILLAAGLAWLAGSLDPATAKERRFIRDTEIEATIWAYSTPLLKAAGLPPQAVRIYIIDDDSLNAFVAGGQNIFLHTGLLLRTENPEQLIGVIAHEIGHIAGGHLPRTSEALRDASHAALLGFVLGGVTAAVTGRADAGIAVFQGGSAAARATLLEYSRAQESAADHAAVGLLDSTGQTARGLAEFLRILSGEEFLTARVRSPYSNTHPLTQERVSFVESHVAASQLTGVLEPAAAAAMHARMVAKLTGFLRGRAETFKRYPESDDSVAARYARAIATYRDADTDRALDLLDGLIREYPEDGYFMDVRGQILFESGRLAEARTAYGMALSLLDDAPMVETSLAQVELTLNTGESNAAARDRLEGTIEQLKDSPFFWHQLAIAYGRTGALGEAALALAEEALLTNRPGDAILQSKRARQQLPEGAPGRLRADDIEKLAVRMRAARR